MKNFIVFWFGSLIGLLVFGNLLDWVLTTYHWFSDPLLFMCYMFTGFGVGNFFEDVYKAIKE